MNSWRIQAVISLEDSERGLPELNQELSQEIADAIADAVARITEQMGVEAAETVNMNCRFHNQAEE